MKIKEITNYLESIAPLYFQEDYDNVGLLVGNANTEIEAALITLDCTEQVVEEAIDLGCNLIIAHHPTIFSGIKKLNGNNYIEMNYHAFNLSRLELKPETTIVEENSFWTVKNGTIVAGFTGFGIGMIAFVLWARRPFAGN